MNQYTESKYSNSQWKIIFSVKKEEVNSNLRKFESVCAVLPYYLLVLLSFFTLSLQSLYV